MKKIRRSFLLFLLFGKRLFKKISFWLLLCAVPLLALGMRNLSAGESGVLHILLCQENPSDTLSGEIIERLLTEKSVIQYTLMQQSQDACALVESGSADAAWIFPDEMQKKLDVFIAGGFQGQGVIRIVEREDNVALRLAREKLFGALYTDASYSLYQNFIREDLEWKTDEDLLLQNYKEAAVEGNLFQFTFINGDKEASDTVRQNYLVVPVRGMLALLVLLCGLTAAVYFLQDQEKGVLDAVPFRKRRIYFYLYQLTAMGAVAVAVLAALWFLGVFTKWYSEILWMVVYVVMCMGFCSLFRRVCGNLRRLAALIPVLMLVSFVLCPVFFPVRQLQVFSCILPPFYYLNVIHNERYLCRMLIYCVVVLVCDTFPFSVHRI